MLKILFTFFVFGQLSIQAKEQSLDYLTNLNGFNSRPGIPSLESEVVYENEWCEYQDEIPYVKAVKWNHPLVKQAGRNLTAGWFSTFSYGDWRKPYGLEPDRKGSDKELAIAKARNFLRVLCGEFRDYPEMLKAKLNVVAKHQVYASGKQMKIKEKDLQGNLFDHITYPAYVKMKKIMADVYAYRKDQLDEIDLDYDDIEEDGYDYSQGKTHYNSHREEYSVPPTSQCEMKFMFLHYLSSNSKSFNGAKYEKELEAWSSKKSKVTKKPNCTEEDFEYMFNFRGHKNFKPLWLESNAFIWNSRRARSAEINKRGSSYYLRPFSQRYARSRLAWSTYLNYEDKLHSKMAQASDTGGGHILYLTDQDKDKNGVADFKLFDELGCGDQGVGGDENCNEVEDELAVKTKNFGGGSSNWDPSHFWQADMNFLNNYPTFEERMARLNQAFDRHTNWGPTSYWQEDASPLKARPGQVKFIPAYSPIVACSYDISASDSFASSDYPSTHEFEKNRTKWMFIIRFKKDDYYNEESLLWEEEMNFDTQYFNETSLSNDYYKERALDKFGWIPPEDVYANVYFAHGAQNKKPVFYEITAP